MTIHELNALTALTSTDELPVWDAEASGEPTKKITASNLSSSVKSLAGLQSATEVNTAVQQGIATSVINNALLNAGTNVTALNARRSGNVAFVSFALNSGTTNNTTLLTFDSSITPTYIDGIYALYNGSGVQITTGSVWIERDNRGVARYYGSTTTQTLYCMMTFLIN